MSPSVRSLKGIPVRVWIPPVFSPTYKIEIEKTDGTTYDITDIVVSGEYTDGITETIGSFNFTFDNAHNAYTGVISQYDNVNVYIDYGATATTLRFKGKIERRNYRKNEILIMGRSMASRTTGITVTESYSGEYTHEILTDILSSYATYITQTNIDTTEGTDTSITTQFYQKKFWECITEICNRASYDAYIDVNSDFHYFPTGTRINTTEAVVHDANLIGTGDFGPDLNNVKNRIIVYGAKVEDMNIIWTEEDSDSIASYDVREEIINDTNIRTVNQASARASYELSLKKDPPTVGEVTSLGLPTIAPGEKIRISDPFNGLNPGEYQIQKFTQKFSNDEPFQTSLTVQKETSTLPKILKQRISFEEESTEKDNENAMRYSWIDTFDTDSGTHTNTEITSGVLKLQSGQSTGNWISDIHPISSDAEYCELRASGDNLADNTYSVSVDNGVTWQTISALNTLTTLSPPGKNLKIRITLNATTTQIKSFSLLYK